MFFCNRALEQVPEIPSEEVTLEQERPIAMGSYADVMLCRWNFQQVAVKRLRVSPQGEVMTALRKETAIAIGLLHPNVVRVYGTVVMEGGMTGIVMEYADEGALSGHRGRLDYEQKVRVATCIVQGLAYLHSKRVAHRDLKPDNVLLFRVDGHLEAKITDFGTSKVIQTMVTNTSGVGTPKYTAPELLDPGQHYSYNADTFSLAMILYELFSGNDPFPGCTMMQVLSALLRNQRPNITSDIPDQLKGLIMDGWATEPGRRPPISRYQAALKSMMSSISSSSATLNRGTLAEAAQVTSMRAQDQVAQVNSLTQPVPMIAMGWSNSCEELDSKEQRSRMVQSLRQSSNMKNMFSLSILKAMEAVPRHLFLDPGRYSGTSRQEQVKTAYTYNRAMGATADSNESSPEIIGVQLSLVKLEPGASVLLIGGKGGYIASIGAQITGMGGNVVTMSAQDGILETSRSRAAKSPFAGTMTWTKVSQGGLDNPEDLRNTLDSGDRFHVVIFCGAIDALPMELAASVLHHPGGSLLAPVQTSLSSQQIQMLTSTSPAGALETRKITEFGVIFEKPK